MMQSMSGDKKAFGGLGEGLARGFLTRSGYEIICSPFRCKIGEIDIIARHREILVFVEVKTRRSSRFGSSIEATTPVKQKQIIKVARFYLKNVNRIQFKFCRFDVIAIDQGQSGSAPDIRHIQDAFRDNSGV
jgi:putative endonuclease